MKNKILIITYTVPYPAIDGGKISIFGTISYLRTLFDITLVIRTYTKEQTENIELLKKIWPEVSIKTVNYYRKETTVDLLYRSAYNLKELIKNKIFSKPVENIESKINFYPFSPLDEKFISFLEHLFSENKFAIVQVEYTGLLNLVHILPADTPKIFVQIENRYTILQDHFSKINNTGLYAQYVVENARATELALMNEYDYIIALNKNDKENLSRFLPVEKIAISSFPILDELTTTDTSSTFNKHKLDKLIFIGSQGHLPNEDGIKWFIEEMYDSIYQQYKIKLYVTGSWEKDFTKKYPHVIFTGFVDNISSLIENSITICPVRLGGGGIRAKVLQAMAMRVPLVSTTLGCEGIENIQTNENVFIANNKEEFTLSIRNIIEDEINTNRVINNAFELIQKYYSEKAVGETRKNIYDKIITNQHKSKSS